MKKCALQIVSWLSLTACVVPAFLFWLGWMDMNAMKTTMLFATIAWFVSTPMWMKA